MNKEHYHLVQSVVSANSSGNGNYKPQATDWGANDSNMQISTVETTKAGSSLEARPQNITCKVLLRTA